MIVYGTASAALLVGLFLGSAFAVAIGVTLFGALALALGLTMPVGRRVRRMQLEFAWWTTAQNATGAIVPGAPFDVRCLIRHRAPFTITMTNVALIAPGGARVLDPSPSTLVLPAQTRNEFRFRMEVASVGRWVIHGLAVRVPGLWGLFEVPLYFPNPLMLKVLPRVAGRRSEVSRVKAGVPVDRHGRELRRSRGGGTELHELRELVPGDPFRSIAWKASARRRKLMVREVEQEIQETVWIVVDCGATMRGGPLGARHLDGAIEAAATEARVALDRGNRVALVAVDGRQVRAVPARDDKAQILRIYDALLAITEVVDEDLTSVDDVTLQRIVGDYLQRQDGIDFSSRSTRGAWDVGRMVEHLRKELHDSAGRHRAKATDSVSALLRQFCLERGIPLPYRTQAAPGEKSAELFRTLQHIAGVERAGASVLVFSDFDDAMDARDLRTTLSLFRSRGQSLEVHLPEPPDAGTGASRADVPPGSVWIACARAERARLLAVKNVLRRAGVTKVRFGLRSTGNKPSVDRTSPAHPRPSRAA
jgi:uncharacterized protein (DUF58 family)